MSYFDELLDELDREWLKTVEIAMEKYGVATPKKPVGEKTAGKEDACPSCGGETDKSSPQPHCPVDGTKPFEEKKGDA